jgi:PAS domain S-box-containing protein
MRSVLETAAGLVGDLWRASLSRLTRDRPTAMVDLLDEIADTAIFRLDAEGRVASWNTGARRLWGHAARDVLGRPLAALYDPEERQRGKPDQDLAQARASGRVHAAGWRARRDGTTFFAETTISTIRAAPGGFAVVAHDATEQRAREDELRSFEARYRTQSEIAFEASVTIDADSGVFVEANDNAVELFGLPRKLLLMRGLFEVSPPVQPDGRSTADAEAALLGRTLAGERPTTEWVIRGAGDTDVPCELRLVRLPMPGRNLCRASITSISARKHAEELVRQSAELVEQNRLIQAASRMKSEFVANMSHELRTPLNAILGFTELMLDGKSGELSELQREFLGDILASGRHLLALINDVLDLAKVEAGRIELRPEPVDLGDLAAEVNDVLGALATQKSLRVTVEVTPDAAIIHADPGRVKQVLYNYVSNAIKFTPDGGAIAIAARAEGGDHVRLEVRDTGIGIRAEDVPKLFSEFRQLDSGPGKRYAGTGLGLALTKRLVELHGGHVGVTSAPGAGSTFFAVLPRVTAGGRRASSSLRPLRDRKKVLVIESDAGDRALLSSLLGGGGYDVEIAATVAAALERSRERAYDAITLDVSFPEGGGLELLGTLRAQGFNTETPIVVVSRVAGPDAVAGFAVSGVLPKPPPGDALLDLLRRAGGVDGR